MLEGRTKYSILKNNPNRKQAVNKQVVQLIKNKVTPLNKSKYEHLQKVNEIIRNKSFQIKQKMHALNTSRLRSQQEEESQRMSGSTFIHQDVKHESKIHHHQLKNLKYLKNVCPMVNSNQNVGVCWQKLRNSIIRPQDLTNLKLSMAKEQNKSNFYHNFTSRKKKQNFFELTTRAQQYLKTRKRQLRERYNTHQHYLQPQSVDRCQQMRNIIKRLTDKTYESILNNQYKSQQKNNSILQKQILNQIRQNMQPSEKQIVRRMKKENNHKRLVMMRGN